MEPRRRTAGDGREEVGGREESDDLRSPIDI